jgi:WD40 repeat protein
MGGHKEEITIVKYDFYSSLVATGCINGEIALYDFETSKIEGLLIGHTGDITALEFMSPYPALITASMDFTVCIWGIKPAPSKLMNVCLKRIENLSWKGDADVKTVVSRLLLWKDDKL